MSALRRARIVFWTIVVLVILLLVVGFAIRAEAREGFGWFTALVAVYGAAAAVAVWWINRRPLRAADGPALARSYV
ncbi:MAG: hypothetical protein ACRDHU_09220, partial [Actinomycetota bacterium]